MKERKITFTSVDQLPLTLTADQVASVSAFPGLMPAR